MGKLEAVRGEDVKIICLNKAVLDFMASKLTPHSAVLEFGAGWSTRWFAERASRVLSVETSLAWQQKAREDISDFDADKYQVVLHRGGQYTAPFNPDLVLVDSEESRRLQFAAEGWRALKRDGWIVFDDAQRPRHSSAVAWLRGRGANETKLRWQPGDIGTAKERLAIAWQKP